MLRVHDAAYKTLEGEDITLAIYEHPEEAISQVHAGWAPGPTQFMISIYGLEGTVFVEGIRDHGVVSLCGPSPEGSSQPIEKVDRVWRWGTEIAVERFTEAIAEDRPLNTRVRRVNGLSLQYWLHANL